MRIELYPIVHMVGISPVTETSCMSEVGTYSWGVVNMELEADVEEAVDVACREVVMDRMKND